MLQCYNRCNVLQTFTNHFTNSSFVWWYGCKNWFCLYNIILEMVASPNNIKYHCNYFLSGVECTRGNRWNGIGFYCRRRAIIKTALTLYKVQGRGGCLVTRLSPGRGIWDIMKLFCENCHKTLWLVWLVSPTLAALHCLSHYIFWWFFAGSRCLSQFSASWTSGTPGRASCPCSWSRDRSGHKRSFTFPMIIATIWLGALIKINFTRFWLVISRTVIHQVRVSVINPMLNSKLYLVLI